MFMYIYIYIRIYIYIQICIYMINWNILPYIVPGPNRWNCYLSHDSYEPAGAG